MIPTSPPSTPGPPLRRASTPSSVQKLSRRHVVAISDSLRHSQPTLSVAALSTGAARADDGRDGAHMLSWSAEMTLRPQTAHLNTLLDEDCVSLAPSNIAQPLPQRALPFFANMNCGGSKREPITNGFERLNNAIVTLVERLPQSTLEDKFDVVSRWIESYHVDVLPRKLAAQLCLVLGVSAEEGGSGTQQPAAQDVSDDDISDSAQPAAVSPMKLSRQESNSTTMKSVLAASYSLHQLMQVLIRTKPVLSPVATRTLEMIYAAIYASGNPTQTCPNEIFMDATASREQLLSIMKHFQHRTYFQESRDVARRLGAVQEFVGQYETVKRRQMAGVKRQIDAQTNLWVGVCFKTWRGIAKLEKEARRMQAAHAAVVQERDKLQQRVASLEENLAQRDRTIRDLIEAAKLQSQRHDIALAAQKYDTLKAQDIVDVKDRELDARKARIESLKAEVMQLRRAQHARNVAVGLQTECLERLLCFPKSWDRARAAWEAVMPAQVAANPQALQHVTIDTACRWVRHMVAAVLDKYRHKWDSASRSETPTTACTTDTPPASTTTTDGKEGAPSDSDAQPAQPRQQVTFPSEVSPLQAACVRLTTYDTKAPALKWGHDAINALALSLLHLHEDTGVAAELLNWERIAKDFLEQPFLVHKVLSFIELCESLQLSLGAVLSDYLLLDENPQSTAAVAVRMLQWCLSPTTRFSTQLRPDIPASVWQPVEVQVPIAPYPETDATKGGGDDGPAAEAHDDEASSPSSPLETEMFVEDPVGDLLRSLRVVQSYAPIAGRCDRLLLGSLTPKMSWWQMEAACRQLTTAELADRAPFTLTSRDLQQRTASESSATSAISAHGGSGSQTPSNSGPRFPGGASLASVKPSFLGSSDGCNSASDAAVQHIIRLHFLFLRQSFLAYAGFEGGNAVSATLSDFGLSKMMRDARVGLTGTLDVNTIKNIAGDGLSAKRFSIALVQIAALRFSDLSIPDALTTLIQRMRATLYTHVFEPTIFGPLRDNVTFQRGILEEMRPDLMKVFRRYAADGPTGLRMGNSEVSKMLHELKMNDDLSSASDIQDTLGMIMTIGGGGAAAGPPLLPFDLFCHFLCVLGALRVKPPWIPLSARVTRFLYDMIITPLQKKLQLQSISL